MRPSTLEIPRGEHLRLSLETAQKETARVFNIRPRTVTALKRIPGIPIAAPVRLGDQKAFEIVENVRDLVRFWPDKDGRINGIDGRQLKAMIHSARELEKMPPQI
jgi:hypothetical protein